MDANISAAQEFEAQRDRLRAVAYRMLGSRTEADDALQESWLRVNRADATEVENLGGWFTTIVARVCLNMLRSRSTRREDSLEVYVPDPIVTREGTPEPEAEAEMADAVGLALMVVLDTLAPAERLAFVLHDMFAVPFDEIATMLDRSPDATRQLASRARRRVQGAPEPDRDGARQRTVVDAFFAAARGGDFDGLVALLDPDIELRPDGLPLVRGPEAVARNAMMFAGAERVLHPVLVNDAAGVVVTVDGAVVAVMGFTVVQGKIVAIDAIANPARLAALKLPV
jgi:RNA polymerase sigma-70 factor (ECF subfamily)